MEDIKPIKVVLKQSNEVDRFSQDNEANREGYDSRVLPPGSLTNEFAHYSLFNFFDFTGEERINRDKNEQLKKLYQIASNKTKSNDHLEVIRFLRSIESRIGTPAWGQSRFEKVYNYLKIADQIDQLEQERNRMENI